YGWSRALRPLRGSSVLRIRRETSRNRMPQTIRKGRPHHPSFPRWEVIQVSRSLHPIVKAPPGLIKSHSLKSRSFLLLFDSIGASWEKEESICLSPLPLLLMYFRSQTDGSYGILPDRSHSLRFVAA